MGNSQSKRVQNASKSTKLAVHSVLCMVESPGACQVNTSASQGFKKAWSLLGKILSLILSHSY